jgi:uncharacterized membrane protein YdfJ with MMPL/SSD domain
MDDMMHNPWTYVVLMAVLILLMALPLVAVRYGAAREKRGGHPGDDPQLG